MRKSLAYAFTLLVSSFVLMNPCSAQVDVLSTIAGDDFAAYTGDSGPAIQAQLNHPSDVCLDANQNIYVVDAGNFVIRKIDALTGIITTVVGNGTSGYSGDGGLATNAQLTSPGYICFDSHGNLYITDGGGVIFNELSSTIRKVDTAGIITTIAGTHGVSGNSGDNGPATAAILGRPLGICTDAQDNIYFCDHENNCIRKISAQTGIITKIAGNGTEGTGPQAGDGGPALLAAFRHPAVIAVNAAGDIYVTDDYGKYLRKIEAATTTVIGLSRHQGNFWSDGPQKVRGVGSCWGITCDPYGDLYLSSVRYTDEGSTLRKVTVADTFATLVAGEGYHTIGYNGDGVATEHKLNYPSGICFNPVNGEIIIADTKNNRIRKVKQSDYVAPTSVIANSIAGSMVIYPNPSPGKFTLHSNPQNNSLVRIFTSIGGLVYSDRVTAKDMEIDLSKQPAGMYYVVITSPAGRNVQKLFISK